MKKFCLTLLFFLMACGAYSLPVLKDGDILFRSEAGRFAQAIQLATHSPYNHVGMILYRTGKPYVFEAVGPVKFTPLEEWIQGAKDGNYAVKRLKDADKVLTPEVLKKMNALARKFKGRGYSGTFDWADRTMYCSELVWKMYQRTTGLELGRMQKLKEMDLTDPRVQKEMKDRFGNYIPLDLKVISPQRVFESDLLTTIEHP